MFTIISKVDSPNVGKEVMIVEKKIKNKWSSYKWRILPRLKINGNSPGRDQESN